MSRVVDYDTMRRASPRSARLSRSRVVGPLSGFQLGKEHKLEAETSSKLSLRAAAAAGDEAAVHAALAARGGTEGGAAAEQPEVAFDWFYYHVPAEEQGEDGEGDEDDEDGGSSSEAMTREAFAELVESGVIEDATSVWAEGDDATMEDWAPFGDVRTEFGFGDESPTAADEAGTELDIDDADGAGRTALHWAAERGHSAIVEALLTAGADAAALTNAGDTALHLAAGNGELGSVQLLLQHSAEPMLVANDGGLTPSDAARNACAAQRGWYLGVARLLDKTAAEQGFDSLTPAAPDGSSSPRSPRAGDWREPEEDTRSPMEKRRQQREEDARLAEEQEEQTRMRLGGGRLQKLEQLAAPTDGTQIHVRKIGMEGWDGKEDSPGRYENEASIKEIFAPFGDCLQATVRHRIQDGQNTSWALVTMGDKAAVERALRSQPLYAGETELTLTRFSAKQAAASTGAMGGVQRKAESKGDRTKLLLALASGKPIPEGWPHVQDDGASIDDFERQYLEEKKKRRAEQAARRKIRTGKGGAKHQIHVRGIGAEGWDGSEHGVGRYENEASLREIFAPFGMFLSAAIRHRIQDGKNTSWALVTMGNAPSLERAMRAAPELASEHGLELNRFSKKQAAASTGAMSRVQKKASTRGETSRILWALAGGEAVPEGVSPSSNQYAHRDVYSPDPNELRHREAEKRRRLAAREQAATMIQARVRGYRARIRAEHLQHARVSAAAAMAIGGEGITAARKAAAAAAPTAAGQSGGAPPPMKKSAAGRVLGDDVAKPPAPQPEPQPEPQPAPRRAVGGPPPMKKSAAGRTLSEGTPPPRRSGGPPPMKASPKERTLTLSPAEKGGGSASERGRGGGGGVGGGRQAGGPPPMKRSPAGRVLQPQPEPEQPEEEDAEQRKRREVEAIWLEIDADRSGGLDRQEVEDVLFKLRLPAFESDIDAAIQALDTNRDGNIDHDEFVRWCMDQESVDEDEEKSTESSDSGGEGYWR